LLNGRRTQKTRAEAAAPFLFLFFLFFFQRNSKWKCWIGMADAKMVYYNTEEAVDVVVLRQLLKLEAAESSSSEVDS
jgi:hypothetical protein